MLPAGASGTGTTAGKSVNAQCFSYFAPPLIQRSRIPISSGVIFKWDFGGGITTSGSPLRIRWIIREDSGSPGTTARPGESSIGAVAPSKLSNRSPASRFSESGPWQK